MGRPTAAERARTLGHGVAGGVLVTPGVPDSPVAAHVTDHTGRSLLLIPAESALISAFAGELDLPATLCVTDVAPVALADRARGRAWLHGWLTEVPAADLRGAALLLARLHPRPELLDLAAPPRAAGLEHPAGQGRPDGGPGGPDGDPGWTVLALEVAEIEVADAWGSATVQPEEYAAAMPDPFVAVEAGMLAHLDACHAGDLAALLRGRCDPRRPAPAVRPLGLDRHGIWLRCLPPAGAAGTAPRPFDLRVAFPEPVGDLDGLRRAYRGLLGARSDLRR